MPEGWMDRDYYGATTLHPLGLLAILILGALLLFLPRRYAIFPIILMACLVPSAQRLVVFSLDFTLLRIMILTGWMRLLYRNELADFTWKPLDTVVVLWAASGTLVYTILWQDASQFIYILGTIFDAVGAYFLFRALINNWGDVDRAAWIFTVISLPVAVAFLIEHTTGRNAFAFLGGVPEITMQRADRLRCQGAFSHPIIAGCFWVSVLPLIAAGLWARHRNRILVIAGIIATLVIIYTCASSTPVTSLLFCLIGAAFFLVRRRMRVIRWGLLLGLVGLHLFMKAPVWHLLSRIDFTGGSTGYHRYVLIDQAINNLNTWWLKGTRSTADWDEVQGLWDITNQYVYEGVNGGLITLVLFVTIIALSYQAVGRMWRGVSNNRAKLALAWALGVALLTHTMSFLAVSYFGQIIIVWYLLLGMIGSLASVRSAAPLTSSFSGPAVPVNAIGIQGHVRS